MLRLGNGGKKMPKRVNSQVFPLLIYCLLSRLDINIQRVYYINV